MKVRLRCIFICVGFLFNMNLLQGQVLNLVPDPSFEDTTNIVTGHGQLSLKHWRNIDSTKPFTLPFAYFHYNTTDPPYVLPNNQWCFQDSRNGDGVIVIDCIWAGLGYWKRRLVRTKLKSTLIAGKNYCAKMYVNPCDKYYDHFTDGIQMYFDNGQLDTIVAIDSSGYYNFVQPQVSNPPGVILSDTASWLLVSGVFTASGNESFLTIGNFWSDSATSRILNDATYDSIFPAMASGLLIEDVSVIPLDASNWLQDVWCVLGDSAYIGLPKFDAPDAEWYNINMQYIGKGGGIKVLPAQTVTQYIQALDVCNTILYDTLTVYATPLGTANPLQEQGFFAYPNPSDGKININCNYCDNNTSVSLFTKEGTKVYTSLLKYSDGEKSITVKLIPGNYILKVENKDKNESHVRKLYIH